MKLCASVAHIVVSMETARGPVLETKTQVGRFRRWLCSLHGHLAESQSRDNGSTQGDYRTAAICAAKTAINLCFSRL
jgi:hypothetical protein